jgi:hypothetical protein
MAHRKIADIEEEGGIAREVGEESIERLEDRAHEEGFAQFKARGDMRGGHPNGGRLEPEKGPVLEVVGLAEEVEDHFAAAPRGARRVIEKDEGVFGTLS